MDGVLQRVKPLENFILEAEFTGGVVKRYDVSRLFGEIEDFDTMKECPEIFREATVDVGGYGVIWNDVLDVAAEEIWEDGITV